MAEETLVEKKARAFECIRQVEIWSQKSKQIQEEINQIEAQLNKPKEEPKEDPKK